MRASTLRRGLNAWPPFLFSGIRVTAIGEDWRHATVELRQRWYNRNYVGTHFGGSLFAMTDPFWMLLTMRSLGSDYIVWDQAGEIRFLKPGRGTVRAGFELAEDCLVAWPGARPAAPNSLPGLAPGAATGAGEGAPPFRKKSSVPHRPPRRPGPPTRCR